MSENINREKILDWCKSVAVAVESPVPRHGMEEELESELDSDSFSGSRPDPFGGARPRETVLAEKMSKNLHIGPSNQRRSAENQQSKDPQTWTSQRRSAENQQFKDPQTWTPQAQRYVGPSNQRSVENQCFNDPQTWTPQDQRYVGPSNQRSAENQWYKDPQIWTPPRYGGPLNQRSAENQWSEDPQSWNPPRYVRPSNQRRSDENQQSKDPQTLTTQRTKAMKAVRLEHEILMMKQELEKEEALGSNPGDVRDVLKALIAEKENKLCDLKRP